MLFDKEHSIHNVYTQIKINQKLINESIIYK